MVLISLELLWERTGGSLSKTAVSCTTFLYLFLKQQLLLTAISLEVSERLGISSVGGNSISSVSSSSTGPKLTSSTGNSIKPFPRPKTVIPKKHLKKIRKIYDYDGASTQATNRVLKPPWKILGPISFRAFLTLYIRFSRTVLQCGGGFYPM